MKKVIIATMVLIVLVGGYMFINKDKPALNEEKSESTMSKSVEKEQTEAMGIKTEKKAIKEFTIDSFEMGFSEKTISVKKGDTVQITLTNSGKYKHDWVVDEFSAKTKQITKGETDTITFVTDKVGEFEYYCSVMQHRKMGMVGKLIISE